MCLGFFLVYNCKCSAQGIPWGKAVFSTAQTKPLRATKNLQFFVDTEKSETAEYFQNLVLNMKYKLLALSYTLVNCLTELGNY